jgi:hypothetical protein
MTDHHTPHRQAWLKTLQPRPFVADTAAAILGVLALLAALFII